MTTSYYTLRRLRKVDGDPCAYCKRPMNIACPHLMPTRDHVHPRSKGGREIVWACWICNHMKDDMTMEQWTAFMDRNPGWWERPSLRRKRAMAGLPRPVIAKNAHGPLPVEQTLTILREGKKAWLEKFGSPAAVPIEYDDPQKQAAFEAAYRDRLHMLREP